LQTVIDTLTAKIHELENEIKSLKEKAAKELQEMQANLLK
jgi:restriction endonuclease S subunit